MPAILDLGSDDTGAVMVTEWLDAQSLQEVEFQLRRVGGDVPVMVETLLAQSLETLAALHDAGIVHGDIAPGNIMISHFGDRTWLIDPAPALASGGLIATRAWAAPELLAGGRPSHITDLFALGRVIATFAQRNLVPAPEMTTALSHPDPRQRPGSASEARLRLRVQASQLRERLATIRTIAITDGVAKLGSAADRGIRTQFVPSPLGKQSDERGAMDDPFTEADFCLGPDTGETAGAPSAHVGPWLADPL